MKARTLLIAMVFVLPISTHVFANEGQQGNHKQENSMMGNMKSKESSAVKIDNKICPVSGQKVGIMSDTVQYEYDGKIYNFCCSGCIEKFKNDPEKYIKIVKEQMKSTVKNGSENPMKMTKEEKMTGKTDIINKKSKHMMMNMNNDKGMMAGMKETMSNQRKKEIKLEAYQFGFSPETITVKKGDVVTLQATSRDVPHGIFIKEYDINEKVEKGKTTNIEFIADKVGEFNILCNIYCGRGHQSMKAKLIVEE